MKKLVLSLLLFMPLLTFSQIVEPITPFLQFNGRYDFTAFGNTLNTEENGTFGPCTVLTQSSADFQLEPGQTFLSAHLYWAGPGNGDFNVKLNGTDINADRTFALLATTGLNYFSAYADVTNILQANGQGLYTFSDLDLGDITPYCPAGTNFGGWGIIVIYEDPDALLNQITLFDGLDYVDRNTTQINFSLTPINAASDQAAKVGFLAWEGDRSIEVAEELWLNGVLMGNPPLNPSNNAFNGTNSYTGSTVLYNMDLDYYDLQGLNIIEPGDDRIDIQLGSGQDFIMVNNVIISVNSELPDATITIDNLGVLCQDRNMEVNYTVANFNSTAELPAGTQIAFYADAVLLGQAQTVNIIPIDGTESGTINLNIPVGTPAVFNLRAVVDDDGTGTGSVLETDEDNNEAILEVDLSQQGLLILGNNESCEGQTETLTANFNDLDVYNWFFNGVPYGGNTPTITVTQSGIYTVSGTKAACFVDLSPPFVVTFNPQPVANPAADLFRCDNGIQTGIFNLLQNDENVLGAQDPAIFEVKYFRTLAESQTNTNAILTPGAYLIEFPPQQTIYVRIHDRAQEMCYDLTQFDIFYTPVQAGDVAPFAVCDQDATGGEDINLPLRFNAMVLNGQNAADYNITYHLTQNDADTRNNPLPNIYTVPVPGQTLYIRIEPVIDNNCFATTTVEITVDSPPTINPSPFPLVACDSDNDGYTGFTLHLADVDITNNDPTLSVSYHYTLLDAQTDENELADPFVNINPYDDRVFARVESAGTTCYSIVELLLEVRDSPVLTEPAPYRLCDDDADGFAVFDLDTRREEILGGLDPLLYGLYFYEDQQDAIDAGELALTAPDFSLAIQDTGGYTNLTPNAQTLYVLGVGTAANTTPNNGAWGCYDIVELQLVVDPLPVAVEPADYRLCDDTLNGSTPTDQVSTFDLTTRDVEVTGGVAGVAVTWFETLADEAADIPIPDPTAYQNITNAQTIVARASNGFGCRALVTLTLVVDPLPTPAEPEPLELCDEGGGFAQFDLTLRTQAIINGEPDVAVEYYPTLSEAEAGGPGIDQTQPYTNVVPFNDSVWARAEGTLTGCYALVELQLVVIPLPDAPVDGFLDPYQVCDLDGDGFGTFDLTLQDDAVYGVQDRGDFAVTYHTDPLDAQSGTGAIDPADAFESMGQPIWVRLESLVTGCSRITEFQLEVGAWPPHGLPLDLEACDDELGGSTADDGISTFDLTENTPRILDGDPSLAVYYYASAADQAADIRITGPGAYQNVSNPQEIFVTVLGQNTCRASESFFLRVDPNPEPVPPSPLYGCDVDNDGLTTFDLDSKIPEIQGGDPGLNITFHESRIDAEQGQYALASPYANIFAFNQTLYVRAAYAAPPAGTGCYTIVALELIVNPSPTVPMDLPTLIECVEGLGGFAEFDLTVQEELILGDPPQSNVTITYHLTEADAIAGTPFIAQPEAFTNTVTYFQTIWVRVDDNFTECFAVGRFDIWVKPAKPFMDPTPLVLCDDLGEENDGITAFDLTVKNSEITFGDLTLGVSYFLTQQDAQDDTNRIDPETAYINQDVNGNPVNPQVLYVRIEEGNYQYSCVQFTTLTLRVVPNPNPVDPDPITKCDVNLIIPPGPYDQTELFDLTFREREILNGNDWTVGYFKSYDDAVNLNDEIVAPEVTAYQNTSNPQTIYVRTTDPGTLCFEIVELELIVNPLPDDTAVVAPYIVCAPDDSEIGVFNLETKVGEILGGQPQPPFEVTFYLTASDAEFGINPIINTTTYQNKDANNNPINPQTIYTSILNLETRCRIAGVQSFELMVQRGAVAVAPAGPFVICDNLAPSDGFAEFDLDDVTNQQVSDLRAEILAGQDPAVFAITFHGTLGSAEAGTDALAFPYVNIINPQRIYVRVTNTLNPFDPQCYAITELVLKVEQLPEVLLDGEYRLCVDANGNPIAQEEGSPSPPVIDTGLDPALYTFVWEHGGVILPGEDGPSIIALQGGEYTVTYTELSSGCAGVATATVLVSSPPLTYSANLLTPAFSANPIVEIVVTGEGTYEYQLDNGPFQDSNIFEGVAPGNHVVTIRDVLGCGSAVLEVGVIDYPPYFTPNGDGYHDTWNIIGLAAGDPSARIYIFDRFGKLIKQLSPMGPGWDGTYNGAPLPSSDYWFRVEYAQGGVPGEFKGHFTLKR